VVQRISCVLWRCATGVKWGTKSSIKKSQRVFGTTPQNTITRCRYVGSTSWDGGKRNEAGLPGGKIE